MIDSTNWLNNAASLPVAFAQAREDPLLDLQVLNRIAKDARVIMVASGGCTAALMAASPKVAHLRLVDPNPAQMSLTRLKIRLLQNTDSAARLALLGHASMPVEEREARLKTELANLDLPEEALGSLKNVARLGPDQTGRYEAVFAALRMAMEECANEIDAVLQLNDPNEQQRRVSPSTELGRYLDAALDEIMALPHLVALFGEEATRNPVEPFSRHFARRLRHVLAVLPARSNPYLWQMLKGCYPEGTASPWLLEPPSRVMPEISWSVSFMDEALKESPDSFDFVHLSNILDWLSPEKARMTLRLAWDALRPGGWTLIRQLNSSLDIPNLGPWFHWQPEEAERMLARDRSFFYRALHLGKKP